MVEKLQYLLLDLDKARKIGEVRRSYVEDEWTVEEMTNRTDALYTHLINKKRKI